MRGVRAFGRELLTLLREIADQNAYQRHLKQTGVNHSAEAWRAFSDARFRAKYQRAKCC